MKPLLAIIIVTFILTACKKRSDNLNFQIMGEWELRKSFGGGGAVDTIYSPGNGNTILFWMGKFVSKTPGKPTITGRYDFGKIPVITTTSVVEMDAINLYTEDTVTHRIFISDNMLTLDYMDSQYDGVESLYFRK